MIFRCHKSRTQYFQNGGEYFTDCAICKGYYLDIYKRNSNCADYSDKLYKLLRTPAFVCIFNFPYERVEKYLYNLFNCFSFFVFVFFRGQI